MPKKRKTDDSAFDSISSEMKVAYSRALIARSIISGHFKRGDVARDKWDALVAEMSNAIDVVKKEIHKKISS